MNHLLKVTLYFFGAMVVTLAFGLGASVASLNPLVLAADGLLALAVAGIATVGGVTITQQSRARFNLMQTGRLVQYASFWLCGFVALKVASLLFASVLVVANAALASLVATALCFAAATATGRIPWKGRTWLPVRMNRRK